MFHQLQVRVGGGRPRGHGQVRDAPLDGGAAQVGSSAVRVRDQGVPGSYSTTRAFLLGSPSQTSGFVWQTLGKLSSRNATSSGEAKRYITLSKID